jgi:hypothetical protein
MDSVKIKITTKNMFSRRGKSELLGAKPQTFAQRFPSTFFTPKHLDRLRRRAASRGLRKARRVAEKDMKKRLKLPSRVVKKRVKAIRLKASARGNPALFIGENSVKIEDTKFTLKMSVGGRGRLRAKNPFTGKLEYPARAFINPKKPTNILRREGGQRYPVRTAYWSEARNGLFGSETATREAFMRNATKAVADEVFRDYILQLDKADRRKFG